MDMNLAVSSSSDPIPKRYRKTKPRVGMIFEDGDNEYLYYVVDLNDENLKEDHSPSPAFRFNFSDPTIPFYGMCFLGSTLYFFASGARDPFKYKALDDDAARRSFKTTRSVFSINLDLSEKAPTVKTLPLGLLWSKRSPVAIPTPKKNGDILVFSLSLKSAPAYEPDFSDFEVYNPLTGRRRGLPVLCHYLVNELGFSSYLTYLVASYAFLNDGRFLVKVFNVILSIDIDHSDQGWQRIETPVLVDNWDHFHSFHDDFWLTAKAGYYIPKGGKMLFKEGTPWFKWRYCDGGGFRYGEDDDDGDDDDDDDDDDDGGDDDGGCGGGDDDEVDKNFELPFSRYFHEANQQLISTLVGDSSLCIVRRVIMEDIPRSPKVFVDLFEFDHDKLLRGYAGECGCKLVSSVMLHMPSCNLFSGPRALSCDING